MDITSTRHIMQDTFSLGRISKQAWVKYLIGQIRKSFGQKKVGLKLKVDDHKILAHLTQNYGHFGTMTFFLPIRYLVISGIL